ncbi:hypothetical protein [Dactylosporangium sp. CA-233914]|uniref:hypothetical protein n=1 Tax=Dactylosporangium sp. CA-233914 TaxID=3239934 RepID=UPI003D93A474
MAALSSSAWWWPWLLWSHDRPLDVMAVAVVLAEEGRHDEAVELAARMVSADPFE